MEQKIIYRAKDGLFNYVGWPTVAKDEKGVIYVACSGHRLGHVCPFGMNYLFKSYDGGETFEGPIIANDTPFDDRDAGIVPLGNSKLLLTWFINPAQLYYDHYDRITNFTSEAILPLWKAAAEAWKAIPEEDTLVGSFIKISEDGGKTWSEPITAPVSSPHGPTKLKNGKLLYLGNDMSTGENKLAAFESEDDGLSWKKLGSPPRINNDPSIPMHEPYQLEIADGVIMGVIRVHDKESDLAFSTYKTFSRDGGKSWSAPEFVCTGSPPHLLLHSSGILILTYARRDERYGQRARISKDMGKTFSEEIILCENSATPDCGYCSSVELSDGSIYTVYYQMAEGDSFCSLMCTKWKLPE